MKFQIEENSVQETLIIPLFGRKKCTELFPSLYQDPTAVELMDNIDYDFSKLEEKAGSKVMQFGNLEVAMRQNDLAWEVRDYLEQHPNAAVVNLGFGLDTMGRKCDNGTCKIYNPDFPGVIEARENLLPRRGARSQHRVRPFRHQLVRQDRCHGRRGILCCRRVLLLPGRQGPRAGGGHGR